jgi:hypothetical protein
MIKDINFSSAKHLYLTLNIVTFNISKYPGASIINQPFKKYLDFKPVTASNCCKIAIIINYKKGI